MRTSLVTQKRGHQLSKIGRLLEPVKYKHVVKAIEKFDKIGRDRFLKEYGFRKAKTCWLIHKKRLYDSKAIVGVAYRIATSRPLVPRDFSGGNPVLKKLRDLGFECKKSSRPKEPVNDNT